MNLLKFLHPHFLHFSFLISSLPVFKELHSGSELILFTIKDTYARSMTCISVILIFYFIILMILWNEHGAHIQSCRMKILSSSRFLRKRRGGFGPFYRVSPPPRRVKTTVVGSRHILGCQCDSWLWKDTFLPSSWASLYVWKIFSVIHVTYMYIWGKRT